VSFANFLVLIPQESIPRIEINIRTHILILLVFHFGSYEVILQLLNPSLVQLIDFFNLFGVLEVSVFFLNFVVFFLDLLLQGLTYQTFINVIIHQVVYINVFSSLHSLFT